MRKLNYVVLPFIFFLSFEMKAQEVLAKIEYSEAEKSFQNEKYDEALLHLEKTKKLLGSTNPKIMYLEIITLTKSLSAGKNELEDYEKFGPIAELSATYINNFAKDVPLDKVKKVYEIKKYYTPLAIDLQNLMDGEKAYDNGNQTEALNYLKKPCEADNPEACKNIGEIYGEQEHYKKMRQYFDKAIRLGSVNAMAIKGYYLYFGFFEVYPQDKVKGKEMVENSLTKGLNYSKYYLGEIKFTEGNKAEAEKLFLESYNLGIKRAARVLLLQYDTENEKIRQDAFSQYDEELEQDPNNKTIHRILGYIFQRDKNYPKALSHYFIAAKEGNADANYLLQQIYEDRDIAKQWGLKKNRKLAKQYAKKACGLDPEYCK